MGSDFASLNWSYFNYTWHTIIDTYDKVIFDDLKINAILTAIMVYMACEDNARFPRDKADIGTDKRTGQPIQWTVQVKAMRTGPAAPKS